MTDRADALIIRFEPRSDGLWVRIEEYWNGCRWAGLGAEFVEDVTVES